MKTPRIRRDPDAIADEVRARVEHRLTQLRFTPETSGFLDCIRELARLLAIWGARTNLTARPDDPAEVSFHILDSLMPLVLGREPDTAFLHECLAAPSSRVLDLGSGAGFPGLVMAAASRAHFTLSESRRKRASFLTVAAAAMGLTNVTVESKHATAPSFASVFDAVTARAVGDLPAFYALSTVALRHGGIAIAFASPSQRLDSKATESAGLGTLRSFAYQLDRDGQRVARLLAVWRKA